MFLLTSFHTMSIYHHDNNLQRMHLTWEKPLHVKSESVIGTTGFDLDNLKKNMWSREDLQVSIDCL